MNRDLRIVTHEIVKIVEKDSDPYYVAASSNRDPAFRESLVAHFKSAACTVTGVSNRHVVAAHIIPARSPDAHFEEVGLTPADKNDPKNGLMLVKGIEEAFDMKRACFLPHPIHGGVLVFTVLDKVGLATTPLFPSYNGRGGKVVVATKMVGGFDNVPLNVERGMLWTRSLSRHAYFAFRTAKKKGWIGADSHMPKDFGTPDSAPKFLRTRDNIEKSDADQSIFQSDCHSELDFEGDDDSAHASGSMRIEGTGLGSLLVEASSGTVARGAGGIAPLAATAHPHARKRKGGWWRKRGKGHRSQRSEA